MSISVSRQSLTAIAAEAAASGFTIRRAHAPLQYEISADDAKALAAFGLESINISKPLGQFQGRVDLTLDDKDQVVLKAFKNGVETPLAQMGDGIAPQDVKSWWKGVSRSLDENVLDIAQTVAAAKASQEALPTTISSATAVDLANAVRQGDRSAVLSALRKDETISAHSMARDLSRPELVDILLHRDNQNVHPARVLMPHLQTPLQKHVAFFDQNQDNLITRSETTAGLRSLGLGPASSLLAGAVINAGLGRTTGGSLFTVDVRNIHRGKHPQDSGVYDARGFFDAPRFESFWTELTASSASKDRITEKEVEKFINGGDKAVMRAVSTLEWDLLLELAGERDGRGNTFLTKERVQSFFDGSLFHTIADEVKAARQGDMAPFEARERATATGDAKKPVVDAVDTYGHRRASKSIFPILATAVSRAIFGGPEE